MMSEDVRTLAAMWRQAAAGGRKLAQELRASGHSDAAEYEQGKADAREYCADAVEALLDGRGIATTDAAKIG